MRRIFVKIKQSNIGKENILKGKGNIHFNYKNEA
jgi:hypothetical protein